MSVHAVTDTTPAHAMTSEEAQRYHSRQIATFAETAADQVTAMTITNADEAIGIVAAAAAASVPVAMSFTVETDGRLPTGQPLHEAIQQVDSETDTYAAYFMVNCAHPNHFSSALAHEGRVAAAARRVAGQLIGQKPCGIGRGDRARRGQPDRARRPARRAARPVARSPGARWVLRHRRPPRGRDRLGLDGELGSCRCLHST